MEGTIGTLDYDWPLAKREAIQYWEKRRLVFLALLIPPAVLFYSIGSSMGDSRYLSIEIAIMFISCFIGANICYSFAYVLEFLFLFTKKFPWFAENGRVVFFVAGCLLGMALAAANALSIGMMATRPLYW